MYFKKTLSFIFYCLYKYKAVRLIVIVFSFLIFVTVGFYLYVIDTYRDYFIEVGVGYKLKMEYFDGNQEIVDLMLREERVLHAEGVILNVVDEVYFREGFSVMLPYILSMIEKSGLSFETLNDFSEMENFYYNEIKLDLKVSGDYHSVINFLNKISDSKYLVSVSSYDISISTSDAMVMSFTVKGYQNVLSH